MLTLGIETIVVLLLVMGFAGALAGYAFAQSSQRRSGGGKSAAELKTELSEYQEKVTEHFQATAHLFQGMTEQYRSIYEHMASGAQDLCDPAQAQIESLNPALLPVAAAANEDEPAAMAAAVSPNAEDTDNNEATSVDTQVDTQVTDTLGSETKDTDSELEPADESTTESASTEVDNSKLAPENVQDYEQKS